MARSMRTPEFPPAERTPPHPPHRTAPCFGLSMSSTPSSSPSRTIGTTISLFDALSQAMWPGKAWTSSTRCTCGCRRRAAHACAERDADAGRAALERAEHQFAADVAVEADPVEVGQRLPDQRRGIGHVGDRRRVRRRPAPRARMARSRYSVGFVRRFDLEVVHQSQSTFPAPPLDRAALLLLVDPLRLGRPLGRVGLRFGLDDMGIGDHFRQPRAGILAVGLLRAIAPRGDQQFAAGRHPAAGDRLQPLIGRGGEAKLEHIDPQLARRSRPC